MTLPGSVAQQITIVAAVPPIRVTALRGEDQPLISGGYGGWTTVARPRRKSLTSWDGIDPLQESLSILLDGFVADESVEQDCENLERLAQPVAGGEPPIVRVIGFVPHPNLDWVLQPLEWTQPVIYSPNGYRTRQGALLHLLEYVAGDRVGNGNAAERARRDALRAAAAAARRAGVGGAPPAHAKFYTVKDGDTLSSIAAHELGDYRRWTEIAALNHLRDPRNLHDVKELRLP